MDKEEFFHKEIYRDHLHIMVRETNSYLDGKVLKYWSWGNMAEYANPLEMTGALKWDSPIIPQTFEDGTIGKVELFDTGWLEWEGNVPFSVYVPVDRIAPYTSHRWNLATEDPKFRNALCNIPPRIVDVS